MNVPLEIVFHHVDRSEALETAIRERAAKLEEFANDIVSCRVTVEGPHKHHRHGNLFAVRVDLRIAGSEIVASRDPSKNKTHADAYVALRDAFRAARRQLQDRVRMRRGDTKRHTSADG